MVAQPFFEMTDGAHTVDYRPSIESQLASKQLTSWPDVVTLPPQCGGAALLRNDGRQRVQVQTVDYGPSIKSQLASKQLTSGPCVIGHVIPTIWGPEIFWGFGVSKFGVPKPRSGFQNLGPRKQSTEWVVLPPVASCHPRVAGLRKDAGLCCGSRLLEGRSVCLCWEHSKPKGPKGVAGRVAARRDVALASGVSMGSLFLPLSLSPRSLGACLLQSLSPEPQARAVWWRSPSSR